MSQNYRSSACFKNGELRVISESPRHLRLRVAPTRHTNDIAWHYNNLQLVLTSKWQTLLILIHSPLLIWLHLVFLWFDSAGFNRHSMFVFCLSVFFQEYVMSTWWKLGCSLCLRKSVARVVKLDGKLKSMNQTVSCDGDFSWIMTLSPCAYYNRSPATLACSHVRVCSIPHLTYCTSDRQPLL